MRRRSTPPFESRPCRSRLALTLALAALPGAITSGCYLAHEHDPLLLPDGARLDGGIRRDGGPIPDGGCAGGPPCFDSGIHFDGGLDFDAGPDAEVDPDGGGIPGRDAEPPVGPTPNPATCRIVPTVHPFDGAALERRWPEQGGAMSDPSSVHVCATPTIIDLAPRAGEELRPSVVFVSYASLGDSEHGTLRIWDPRSETTISYPSMTGPMGPFGPLEPSTNLAAGDLDGDGDSEIVGMGVDSGTFAFHHDGTLMWESAYPTAIERGTRWARTIGGAVSLADLEGDGTVEVIVGRTVLEGRTGAHRWTGSNVTTTRGANGSLGPISCVADLDDDGIQEIIAGRTAMRADGSVMWANEAAGDGLCAVADVIASNPGPEVVLASIGYLYVFDNLTGATLWERLIEGRGTQALGGPPTIADFDGDGRAEIGVAHGSAYGVYDLDCTRRDPAMGCRAAGVRWTAATEDDSSAATGSSVFDFNGDGRAEVVYNDQFFLRIYDGAAGTELWRQPNSSRTRTENPVVVDVDNDGEAEIVVTANAEAWYLRNPRDRTTDPGVEIWGDARGRWVGARRIWNQHSYHITNISETGHVESPQAPGWSVLNAYRQNLREGGDVLVVPDLWGGRGQYECVGRDRARIRIDVQNWGLERVGEGVVVRVYRGRPGSGDVIGEAVTTGVLLPEGGSETVFVEVPLTREVVDLWAVIDDPEDPAEGAIQECREENNEVLIWRPSCP